MFFFYFQYNNKVKIYLKIGPMVEKHGVRYFRQQLLLSHKASIRLHSDKTNSKRCLYISCHFGSFTFLFFCSKFAFTISALQKDTYQFHKKNDDLRMTF